MKRIYLVSCLLFTFLISNAQECTTLWPYIYSDFLEGSIVMEGGKTLTKPVNIHILESKLQYIEGENIIEANLKDVVMLKIGQEKYIPIKGQMMKIIIENEKGMIALMILGNFEAVVEEGGAYGSSSNTLATMKLSSIDIGGKNIMNHMELKANRDLGKSLPLIFKYFVVVDGNTIPATRKGIEEYLQTPEKIKLFRKFIKTNKINWNKPDNLNKILDFFA